jgi:NitT/TauT family transport system ATP-binding protein
MNTAAGHIDVRDVNISFKSRGTIVDAVKSVSLNVQPGEFVSLIGPSGCGKSTLMNAVAGFTKIDTGALLLDGKRIQGPGADRGVVFQHAGRVFGHPANASAHLARADRLAGV